MYHRKENDKDIFECSNSSEYAKIQLKDGEIIEAYYSQRHSETRNKKLVLHIMREISIKCLCEVFKHLKSKSEHYEFTRILLACYEYSSEESKLINEALKSA